ncbi:MAG TPA: hypothetical protein VN969_42710 [Streptosporangiaceae bacterium]|nr:hypothetical protein [Streptosporangiaceae bacterium]
MNRPNTKPASRKRCPHWPNVPITLAVAVLMVMGLALAVALGDASLHHFSSATSILWGK